MPVKGPTSALTEFLRERGIQPTTTNRFKRRQVESESDDAAASDDAAPSGDRTESAEEAAPPPPKRMPRPKINMRASMNFDEEEDDDMDFVPEDDEPAPAAKKRRGRDTFSLEPAKVTPGESTVCGACGTRFATTRYTRRDLRLGLLCWRCNKTVPKAPPPAPPPRAPPAKRTLRPPRRRNENVVETRPVLPTLQSLCINRVGTYIENIEALGPIGQRNTDAISQVICKNRRLSPVTLKLFLAPRIKRLALYDCSSLDSESLQTIPMLAPDIEELCLQFCGQLDNAAFEVWMDRLPKLHSLELYGPFLVRRETWVAFLERRGAQLTSLKLRETQRFDRSCIEALVRHCPRIQEVGLAQIGPLDDDAVRLLAGLRGLRYLDVSHPGVSEPGMPPASLSDAGVVPVLEATGGALRELDLSKNAGLTDAVVDDGLIPHCHHLESLAIQGNEHVSGEALARFFKRRGHALRHVSLSRCTHVDDTALEALVHAANKTLRTLTVNSAAHITSRALRRLADAAPPLETIDLGFVRCVDNATMSLLAERLPTLKTVYIFGCHQVTRAFQTDRITIVGREHFG